MKKITKILLFCACIICVNLLHAQDIITKTHDAAAHKDLELFDFSQFPGEIILEVPYAKYHIRNSKHVKLLKAVKVTKIQLVYSWYKAPTANQKRVQRILNIRRMRDLYRYNPSLFNDTSIEWEMLGQTKYPAGAKARTLFHGFIIHYTDKNNSKVGSINLEKTNKLETYATNTNSTTPTTKITSDIKKN